MEGESRPRDFAWFELTQSCNLKCVHCYGSFGPASRVGKKLTGSQWKDALTQVRAAGFDRVQFIGGEPLMHRSLTELLFAAAAHSFSHIEVFSNLTLLDDRRLNAMAATKACLATTLYSVDPDVHDEVTGVKGSFSDTVRGIDRARQWHIPVRVSCIVTGTNEDRVGPISEFVERRGATFTGIDQSRPTGRGAASSCRTTVPRKTVTPPFSTNRTVFAESQFLNPCWKGKITITEDGSVFPCIFGRECVAGNILDASLDEILHHGMRQYWFLSKDDIDTCRDCEFRYACTDCRPMAQGMNAGDLHAKTSGCGYDPFSGRWK
jgi:radical SAM protein with 4Fe4S-binding SPASM domain